jgi:hypothetical protein
MFAASVSVTSALVGLVVAFRHEWWRDEANTWLVVRSSDSVRQLLATIGFNGHPKAYYVLVWLLSRVSPSPLSLSIVNLGFAVTAIFLFAAFAPFSRLSRALFAFGFFPLYQYGIIVRCYAALLALLCGYAALYTRAPERRGLRFLVLAALAQVHFLAALAAAALFAFELASYDVRRLTFAAKACASAVLASGLATAYQLLPPDRSYRGATHASPLDIALAAPSAFMPNFDHVMSTTVQQGIGVVLCGASWLVAASNRRALVRYAALCATLVAMSAFVYSGQRWHNGFFFVYFLVALWLAGGPAMGGRSAYVALLLAVHAALGLYALFADFRHPYSDGSAVAGDIRSRSLDRLPLVGVAFSNEGTFSWDIDEIQPVLLGLDRGRAYDPVEKTFEPFWRHYYDRDSHFARLPQSMLAGELSRIARGLHSPLLVVGVLGRHDPVANVAAPLETLLVPPPSMDDGERLCLYVYPLRAP